ncbi:hypothetical protein [Streptomyces sp. RerS4]|uniref:hypothetical protein n=1 Tax=Streptomyces sp. RerS4 TaxID=2942449 RepID=UPI00201BB40A|nr:hypothetical protein [Streptomyces sp. RerS4]UQX02688.1 hypothetical protein M4D82_21000 [Streptomyces sp. RerS4]
MSARRPLLTALGATTLLAALWFVPSANATAPDRPARASGASDAPASANTGTVTGAAYASDGGSDSGSDSVSSPASSPATVTLTLADTGSVDTTPYVLGGTLFLGLGAGFVTFSVHRSRTG